MAAFVQFLNAIKTAILRARSTDELRRLLKWAVAAALFVMWYGKLRCRKHDNIVMAPDWSPITGHFTVAFQHWDHLIEHNC